MPRSKVILTPIKPKADTTVPMVIEKGPSMLQVIKEGAAFGTGSTLARIMLERIIGPTQVLPPSRVEYEPCYMERRVFERCILNQHDNIYCRNEEMELSECIKVTEKKLN